MNALSPIKSSSELIEGLAEVIGQAAVVKLCSAFGGTKIYIPARIAHTNPISHAIGAKAATLLAEHYYGTQIDLPKAHLRRQRVLELAQSGEMTVAEAARACDYTERRVYQLLAERKEESGQLELFGR